MFTRYAVYFTPDGALAEAGAAWLGWDLATGQPVANPDVAGLDLPKLTQTPRKYGFHATLKPPFVLREGQTVAALHAAFEGFCASAAPVTLDGLTVSHMGRFFAMTPLGDVTQLRALAGTIVSDFDDFRAAPSEDELARRRGAGLSEAQEQHLTRWGYPYVMDQFRFHMTLSGRVENGGDIAPLVEQHFANVLPAPFVVDHLSLAGQRADGMFERITRLPLGGAGA